MEKIIKITNCGDSLLLTLEVDPTYDSEGHVKTHGGIMYRMEEKANDFDLFWKEVAASEHEQKLVKAAANWQINHITGYMKEHGITDIRNFPISADRMFELICYCDIHKTIDFGVAKSVVFLDMIKFPEESVWNIIERHGFLDKKDSSEIEDLIRDVISQFPDKVAEYKGGKKGILGMLMGQVMPKLKGKADPKEVNVLMLKLIEE